jgi:hypothetical protein
VKEEVRRKKYAAALVVCAVAAGVAYTLSPLSFVCAVTMALVIRWTVSGLDGRERRWVLTTMCAALALRAIAIAVLPFLVDPSRQAYTSYFGDAQYAIQRSIWIRNVALGIPVASRDYFEAFEPVFGWSGYNYALAFLQALFGPSPYGLALFSATLFLAGSAILYRQCRANFGRVAASGGLVWLVFLPTWFAWSVAPLKESAQFLLLTVAGAATMAIATRRAVGKLVAMAALAGALALSDTLRTGGLAIAAIGVIVAATLWLGTRRRWTAALVLCLMIVGLAIGARTPAVRNRVILGVREAALRHWGHVLSPGSTYQLLDQRFYARVSPYADDAPPFALSFDEGVRYLIRAVVAFFVQPLPSTFDSFRWLALTPIVVLWYAANMLALVGAVWGMARRPLLTSWLAGLVVAGVVVIAPNSGNVGTLIRHRDIVAPFVIMLAAFGGLSLLRRAAMPSDFLHVGANKAVASWR